MLFFARSNVIKKTNWICLIFFKLFNRFVREIVQNVAMTNDFRMQRATIDALQEIVETMLISNFENKSINIFDKKYLLIYQLIINLTIIYTKRIIIQIKNINLISIFNRANRELSIHVFSMQLLIFENVWFVATKTYLVNAIKFTRDFKSKNVYKLIKTKKKKKTWT